MVTYSVDTVAIKKIMLEQGIETIGELAERAELDRNTTSAVVNSRKRPSSAVMEKLMTALNINPKDAGAIFFVPNLRNT